MRLWILRRIGYVDYDQYGGAVVRASTEEEAREIARDWLPELHSYDVWGSETMSCAPLAVDGEPGVIIQDYRPG